MIEAIVAGLTLGTGSGAAPGPLMGMAISRTMRRGLLSGLRIAFAPLISDTLIILLSLTVVSQLSNQAISILGIVGAVVVAAFGIETLVSARKATLLSPDDTPPSRKGVDKLPDVLQGAAINVLNPAPWIFWITAGSTLLVDFWRESPPAAIAFLATFLSHAGGSKSCPRYRALPNAPPHESSHLPRNPRGIRGFAPRSCSTTSCHARSLVQFFRFIFLKFNFLISLHEPKPEQLRANAKSHSISASATSASFPRETSGHYSITTSR